MPSRNRHLFGLKCLSERISRLTDQFRLSKKWLAYEVKATYDQQMDPRHIDPMETCEALITALDAAALNPDLPRFSVAYCRPRTLQEANSSRPHELSS